jgi:hypothetical protein
VDAQKRKYWLCHCDCGGLKVVREDSLKQGRTTQCKECSDAQSAKNRTKHGMTDHPLFDTWKNMIGRCYDENHTSYMYYGGRGIQVVERWHKVENFVADMDPRPDGYTLDRIDNNEWYSPGNCRWASRIEQANNTSNNSIITYKGVTRTVAEWSRILGILDSTIRERLKAGWPVERVLSGGNKRKW